MTNYKKLAKKICCVSLAALLVGGSAAVLLEEASQNGITANAATPAEYFEYEIGNTQTLNDAEQRILDYLEQGVVTESGSLIEVPQYRLNEAENYFIKNVDLTDEQAEIIINYIDEGMRFIAETGVSDISELDSDMRQELVSIAQNAIDDAELNVSISIESDGIYISSEPNESGVTITGYKGSDTDVVIPSEIEGHPVTTIEVSAFDECANLKSITIPDSVTKICVSYEQPFISNCKQLTSINVDDKNEYYSSEDGVLFNKDKSVLIRCPEGKKGAYSIPDGVKTIGGHAFVGCEELTSITIPESVTDIEEMVQFVDHCKKLTDINVDNKNEEYSSENGVLFTKDKDTLIRYPEGKKGAYSVPDGVTHIYASSFYDCTGLTSINIPDSVNWIGNSAFVNCTGLTSITIPDSVEIIYMSAFAGCTGLTSVIIKSGYTCIDIMVFDGCENLTIYGISGSLAEEYAKENGFAFVAIDGKTDEDGSVLSDKDTGITVKGAVPEGASLLVKLLDYPSDSGIIAAYDISLVDSDNITIQPDGTITISIPCDRDDCKVMWVQEDGTKTDMNAVYENGCYVFTTDHLSVYQIVQKDFTPMTAPSDSKDKTDNTPTNNNNNTNTNTDVPQTGDNGIMFVLAAFAAMVSGAVLTVCSCRKKTDK